MGNLYISFDQKPHYIPVVCARYVGPWSIIGDFNAVLGTHEKYGRYLPNKTFSDEYLNWNNSNNLIHLDAYRVV